MNVRDVMHTEVVTVPLDMSARQLARLLADEEISGVPVLDGNGKLAGVVSQTDLVRLAAQESDIHLTASALRREAERLRDPDEEPEEPDPFGYFLPEDTPFSVRSFLDGLPESEFDTVTVGEIMTAATFSVSADMTLRELAGFLARGRIHRALVVESGRLLGIVTSNDVLRVVSEGQIDG